MVSLGTLAVAAPLVAALAVTGFVVQRATSDDATAAVALPDNRFAAPVVACPGGPTVDRLHNGDRIFAIGVHDDADGWLLIRNPTDPAEHWYIEARWVSADASTDDLPEIACDDPVPDDVPGEGTELAAPAEDTTTTEPDESTTTSTSSSTTTAAPDQTTTTRPGPGPTPDPGPSPGPGPGPNPDPGPTPNTDPGPVPDPGPDPDPTPPAPTIGRLFAAQPDIAEKWTDSGPCAPPATSTIVAEAVTNATSVTMSWSGAATGSAALKLVGNNWAAKVGPFPFTTIGDGNPTDNRSSAPIHITVTATGPGGSVSRTTSVTLHDCAYLG